MNEWPHVCPTPGDKGMETSTESPGLWLREGRDPTEPALWQCFDCGAKGGMLEDNN